MTNPYLKNASRKSFVLASTGESVKNVTRPGSKEKLIASNDEVNAYDKKDLQAAVRLLSAMRQSGEIVEEKKSNLPVRARLEAEKNLVIAGLNDRRQGSDFMALGEVLAEEIRTAGDRDGFAANFLASKNLGAGEIARWPVSQKQTSGIHAVSPTFVVPSVIRQGYFYPDEFYVNVNIRIEDKEIAQNPMDILEKKFGEGLEQSMVIEDRVLRQSMIASSGVENDPMYFGIFSPAVMQEMKTNISEWGLSPSAMLISLDIWNNIVADAEWQNFFDQVTKHQLILDGYLGSILGVNIVTDGYRDQHLKVLERGEVYMLAQPAELGGMTKRGEEVAEPIKGYSQGEPWRGWFLSRLRSVQVINTRGVVRATRNV